MWSMQQFYQETGIANHHSILLYLSNCSMMTAEFQDHSFSSLNPTPLGEQYHPVWYSSGLHTTPNFQEAIEIYFLPGKKGINMRLTLY